MNIIPTKSKARVGLFALAALMLFVLIVTAG